jgi:cyclopropane fatty-acyl-phospholipid synthase-like methyltransferase
VWSDPISGWVYERGARSTTPLAGARHADLHDRLTELALRGAPGARKILDLGCGFGKSTRPFYERLPEAEIHALDLAAPCLRLAARAAADAGARNVRYRQAELPCFIEWKMMGQGVYAVGLEPSTNWAGGRSHRRCSG